MTSQLDPSEAVVRGNLANYATEWSAKEYTQSAGLWPIEAELVERYFPPAPAPVIDIGCGAGRTSGELRARGYDVVAIDLAPALLALARQRHPGITFLEMDARRLAFPDGAFGAVLFSYNGLDTIYPEQRRIECLNEFFRVLKPGGTLVFSSHNLLGAFFSGGFFYLRGYLNAARLLAAQMTNGIAREWYIRYFDGGGPQHLFSAPPSRTVRQLRDIGFEVLDVRGSDGERNQGRIALRHQHVNFAARRPLRS